MATHGTLVMSDLRSLEACTYVKHSRTAILRRAGPHDASLAQPARISLSVNVKQIRCLCVSQLVQDTNTEREGRCLAQDVVQDAVAVRGKLLRGLPAGAGAV